MRSTALGLLVLALALALVACPATNSTSNATPDKKTDAPAVAAGPKYKVDIEGMT